MMNYLETGSEGVEVKDLLKKWAGLVGAFLVSRDKNDINKFYDKKDPDLINNTIIQSNIEVTLK